MPGLTGEIDNESAEQCVYGGDLPEAPTPVHAISGLRQLHQRFHVLTAEFAGRNQFLKLFSHS